MKQRPTISATVIRGHRVASGLNEDPRFPGGTLAMQAPFFRERGLDLSGYYLSTLNLSIFPFRFEIVEPRATFRDVAWNPEELAEDFSFFDCRIRTGDTEPWVAGLIYYPHPETKPEHFQPDGMLEVIASSLIKGIEYGTRVEFQADPGQMRFMHS